MPPWMMGCWMPSSSVIRVFMWGCSSVRLPVILLPPALLERLHLLDRPRPVVLEQAGERSVGEDPSTGLAAWTVVGLARGVDDALHRGPAGRAGLPVAAMDRHALAEGG